jgi:hypothetical protein
MRDERIHAFQLDTLTAFGKRRADALDRAGTLRRNTQCLLSRGNGLQVGI